ncbi:type II toxin-antitoxin system ParD family antitoxin [Agrobacterium vitis]|uniref:Type II toxin-antitoxin system ParD family antitoxin n=1 Tax=Agrobacterium vitis TaxID=373 RepID=A0AAE4WFM8_AGRVI|nr:type II toxin-antitoxin system ParD family antitoxin [Agrobacterium vitis]MCF1499699.1 type II toxin-antitoxin system ParD family antitoxin [Allorhizobium sp. Av2]MCM2440767.1 type II toxin-antitoxin system ParD family antitoxin [Agrobacterium vitis]MUZ59254.1 type II toxin-antitoxin system ParD family antitoxin [Agrobacterium vitis]MVA66903.1 type II toxin-antitoxin system ParD family antitoxin [Agrobacterium vitis]MVA87346.1 type II toxin-antitoxin system ParD family antitoxin [Agrobacter
MTKPVDIAISDQFAPFIDRQVESGRYGSPREVVEAGMRLLEQEQRKLNTLRQALTDGENSGPARKIDRQSFINDLRSGL